MRLRILIIFIFLGFPTVAQVDLKMLDVATIKYLIPGTHNFIVAATNLGSQVTNHYNINWQVDGGPVSSFTNANNMFYIGSLKSRRANDSFQIVVGSPGIHYVKAWITSLTYSDTDPSNDTIVVPIKVFNYLPQKNVVLETYKHQSCTPCYPAAQYVKHHTDTMPHYAVANVYTDPTDELYCIEGDTINSIYFPAHPAPAYDRYLFPYSNEGLTNSYFEIVGQGDSIMHFGERERYYEPVEVDFHHIEFDSITRLLTVKLRATFYDTLVGDYRFNVFLTEDSVNGYQAGAPDENNYYHMKVMRRMLGSAWGDFGSLPSNIYPSQQFFYELEYIVPMTFKSKNLNLIGLVQKFSMDSMDRRILNSASTGLSNALYISAKPIKDVDIDIYPNPFTDKIFVQIDDAGTLNNPITATMLGTNGEIIFQKPLYNMKTVFDVEHLPAGHYMFKVESDNIRLTKKILK